MAVKGRCRTVISCHINGTLVSWQSRLWGHSFFLVTFSMFTDDLGRVILS